MESPSPFDLNAAIQEWRKNLASSPAVRAEDGDELEAHLRDAVAALQSAGLSASEAFWVARQRLGSAEVLDHEFGKVNVQKVWLHRALWMVIGWLGIEVITALATAVVSLTALGIDRLTTQGQLLGPFSAILYPFVLVGLFALVWQSGRQNNERIGRIGCWARSHPISASVIFLLIWGLNLAVQFGITQLMLKVMLKVMPMERFGLLMHWLNYANLFSILALPLLLVWLLTRTTRRIAPPSEC